MSETLSLDRVTADQNQRIAGVIEREHARLRNFVRKRVADEMDVEDILQDVFSELVEAYRLMKPVEQIGSWLFTVARNRIIDLFRRKKPEALEQTVTLRDEGPMLRFEDLLPSTDAGPDTAYARAVLIDELEAALDELPREQRAVFIAHEIEGRSFKELALESGLGVNTLISRKHYAVRQLRRRLQTIYNDSTRT